VNVLGGVATTNVKRNAKHVKKPGIVVSIVNEGRPADFFLSDHIANGICLQRLAGTPKAVQIENRGMGRLAPLRTQD
jgi:hypothetical protein